MTVERSESDVGVHAPLRIALVSPPLNASGGIGRLMSYVLAHLDSQQVSVRHIDSRGRSSRPILTFFPMLWASLTVVALKATHRVDLVHINVAHGGSTVRKGVIAWLCYLIRIPTVLHLHSFEYGEFFRNLPPPFQWVIRKMFQRADHIIVLGHIWESFLKEELLVSERSVSILYNAAPGPPELESRQSELNSANVRLLFVGQLGARKGVPELLHALSRIPLLPSSWSITMAGDGDIDRARQLAIELGIIDRVTFTGWLDSAQIQGLLESSDVLILPSHAEGFPMAIVEAFAYGVAVISSPVGAIAEIVLNNENGLLVPVGDVDGLEQAIEAICSEGQLRERLGLAGRRTWEDHLNVSIYANRLAEIWIDAAGRERGSS
jgi:glycosyltransferase involved in cell wall biosynthesis